MTKTLKCIEEWKKHNNKRIPEDVLERIEFLEEELSSAYEKISDIAEKQHSAQDDIPESLRLMG
jgi:predicted transcriptional regulator